MLRKEELPDAELPAFYATRNVDAAYDVDSRVGVLLAAAQHKGKGEVRGGRGRRAKKKACLVTGRVLEPDQSKGPLHAARRKNPCSVVGCTAKAKASLLCKTKTTKKPQVRCKKHSKKGSARCSRFAARLLSPANVHVCTKPGAHGIYSAWRCEITAAHGKKKGFFHAFQRRQSDLLLSTLQQRPSSTGAFAAIRIPRTSSARLVGVLRALGKMVSARSMVPLGSAL